MTVTNRLVRPTARRANAIHLFTVGQSVRLRKHPEEHTRSADIVYRITGTMPAQGSALQYRIRSDQERHERVAIEDSLEPLRAPSGSAALIEKTFK
jgi:hypothetical protein